MAAKIESGIGAGIGVNERVDIGCITALDRHYSQLIIEGRTPMTAAFVPAVQRLSGQPRQAEAPAGVDTGDAQCFAGQPVNRRDTGNRQARIPLRHQPSMYIVRLTAYQRRRLFARDTAQIGDLTNRQATAITHCECGCARMYGGGHRREVRSGGTGSAVSLKSSLA
ncbi:hypothetical protein [Pseudomonas sp. TH15]|uniref:hypothetical protein n=1 Tax=Pseudomonas sp. TH15 TaxID=2796381 RepID=UPI001F5B7948|nr:hypothetical protein [Pseudomonas sp. TH15]